MKKGEAKDEQNKQKYRKNSSLLLYAFYFNAASSLFKIDLPRIHGHHDTIAPLPLNFNKLVLSNCVCLKWMCSFKLKLFIYF